MGEELFELDNELNESGSEANSTTDDESTETLE